MHSTNWKVIIVFMRSVVSPDLSQKESWAALSACITSHNSLVAAIKLDNFSRFPRSERERNLIVWRYF